MDIYFKACYDLLGANNKAEAYGFGRAFITSTTVYTISYCRYNRPHRGRLSQLHQSKLCLEDK